MSVHDVSLSSSNKIMRIQFEQQYVTNMIREMLSIRVPESSNINMLDPEMLPGPTQVPDARSVEQKMKSVHSQLLPVASMMLMALFFEMVRLVTFGALLKVRMVQCNSKQALLAFKHHVSGANMDCIQHIAQGALSLGFCGMSAFQTGKGTTMMRETTESFLKSESAAATKALDEAKVEESVARNVFEGLHQPGQDLRLQNIDIFNAAAVSEARSIEKCMIAETNVARTAQLTRNGSTEAVQKAELKQYIASMNARRIEAMVAKVQDGGAAGLRATVAEARAVEKASLAELNAVSSPDDIEKARTRASIASIEARQAENAARAAGVDIKEAETTEKPKDLMQELQKDPRYMRGQELISKGQALQFAAPLAPSLMAFVGILSKQEEASAGITEKSYQSALATIEHTTRDNDQHLEDVNKILQSIIQMDTKTNEILSNFRPG